MSEGFEKEIKTVPEEAEEAVSQVMGADVEEDGEASEDWSVTVKVFDDEDEEEAEEETPFQSSRAAAAAFHSRNEDEELRRQKAAAAVREGNTVRKAQSRRDAIKLIGSIVAAVVVLGLVWAGVEYRINKTNRAADPDVSFYYTAAKDGISVFSADSWYSPKIIVPDKIDGKDVIHLSANCFAGREKMECIVLPETLREIGYNAFKDCTSLREITVPDRVEIIGYCTFAGCRKLETVHLPQSLSVIEFGTFAECLALKNLEVPSGVTRISHGALQGCRNLREVNLPDGLTNIEYDAFRDCSALVSIEIPDNVNEIGASAFAGCTSLTSVTIPSRVDLVSYTFSGCTSLREAHIPESVTLISDNTFKNCPQLTIYGQEGSYAQKYAQKYDIPFVEESPTSVPSDKR